MHDEELNKRKRDACINRQCRERVKEKEKEDSWEEPNGQLGVSLPVSRAAVAYVPH